MKIPPKDFSEKPKILVVDDEQVIRQLFQRALKKSNYFIETATDGQEALTKAKKTSFNLLILDLKMPGINGVEVLKKIKKINPYIEIIIVTGFPTIELAVEAIKIGAFDFICKPFDMKKISLIIETCLKRQKLALSHIRLGELTALFEISKIASVSSNLDSILGRILDSSLEIISAKKGSIYLYDEKTKELKSRAIRGLNEWELKENSLTIRKGLATVRESKVLVGAQEKKYFSEKLTYPKNNSRNLTYSHSLDLPLYSQGNLLGEIRISDKVSGENFTEREQTILSVLAGQASAAIENNKLYRSLEGKIEALKEAAEEINQAQHQLIQTEKMAAVGRLAFGIAHEIRNPLAIISEGVEFLKTNLLKKGKLSEESIKKIKNCVERANKIIVELLRFSRTSEVRFERIDLRKVLEEAESLTKNNANLNNVSITRNFPKKAVKINADYNMLRQAFFNIYINAIDAMPKGGRLGVTLEIGKKAKGKAIVLIKDTGCGIAKEQLSEIFSPFFTTKEPGQGTGLGLSIAHLIFEKHKANIDVESRLGKGTKFTVKLPLPR
ncbi:MAG: response regulator [Omnitrophica bacterium]|nr:response regulator [Candidatus Omnitrophota bacterium]